MEWIKKAVFYQIYPLGLVGAPKNNVGEVSPRLRQIKGWIDYLKTLGVNAIYFGPLFEASSHGYDTKDYYHLDTRLGADSDLKDLINSCHEAGIRVVVDGVFNHVGREFWAFKDLKEKGLASHYKDWFSQINFNGQSPYGDGFSYEGWEGHYNLVKLNLHNEEVIQHLLGAVASWIDDFKMDGIRLDVAYRVDKGFLNRLRNFCKEKKPDFWLMGECIHGDYRTLIGPTLLDSTTNYECYKGIYSSHNDKNYFEINYSLNRLFGKGGIYQDLYLYNFVDNHDVSRIGSILKNPKHLENVYTLLFTMPGIPSIYYGSEWAIQGEKKVGSDDGLRPAIACEEIQEQHALVKHIKRLIELKKALKSLEGTSYETVLIKNEQLVFKREYRGESIWIALNLADQEFVIEIPQEAGRYEDLLEDQNDYYSVSGKLKMTVAAHKGIILKKVVG